MTVSTPARPARAAEVSTRNSDSGVVMRTSGGLVAKVRRSFGGVSPVRTPTRTSATGTPCAVAAAVMPTSGDRRFRSTSAASAFRGETYSTRQRRCGSSGGGSVSNRSIAARNAASVLPDPVGATTSACSPEAIASHAPACACVGASNAPSNHARVGAEKGASGSAEAPVDVIDPFSPAAPTRRVRYHPRRPRPPPGYTNHDGAGTRTPCPQGGTTMHEHELFDAEATAVPSELQGLTDALATAEGKFLDKPNVVGVALGHKITDGVMSDTPSIMVLVSHKVPADMLRPADRVTKTVDNTPTDVLEVGHLVAGGEAPAEPLRAVDAQTLASRVRPVRPGYSVGHPKVTAGTIGAGCYDIAPLPGMPERYSVLSNNHVLATSDDAQIGDPVYQPGVFDGGGPADAIGRLARYVPIRFDGTCNYVDAALAEVPFDTIDRDIYWSGYPTTAATAAAVG